MSDTSEIITASLAESTEVAASEPIMGDETPAAAESDAAAEGSDGSASESAEAEPQEASEEAPAAPAAPQKRRGPLPYDRHVAVLTNTRNKYEAQLAAKEAEYKARVDALSKYESPDHQAQLQFLSILESSPDRAVQILRQIDPDKFGKLSWAEQREVAAAVAGAPAQPAAEVAEMPQPDALLPDGTLGYSAEGAQKLLEWRMGQERAAYQKDLKALRDEIAPIKGEREARVALDQSMTRMRTKLEEARATRPQFRENEAEMKAYLAANPTAGLDDAYFAVVVPKLVEFGNTAEARAREKLLKERIDKSKANTIAPGRMPAASTEESASSGPRSTADVIREALRANG